MVGSEFEVFQSALPVVRINEISYEFQLKKRDNLTAEIRPSPTSRLQVYNITSPSQVSKNVTQRREETPVPLIASLYHYDKEVVQLLRLFIKNPQKSLNVSSQHRHLIERYVKEWDEVISVSRRQEREESSFADQEITDITLPRELEKMYKLVRMSHRVSIELQTIFHFSADVTWTEVVRQAQKTETNFGKFFTDNYPDGLSYGMLKISEMYFTHPQELYPKDIITKIPLKDLVSVAFSGYTENLLKESIKWLSFASTIKANDIAVKEEFVADQSRLEDGPRSSPQENKKWSSEASSHARNSTTLFSQNYLTLITHILHFKLDAILKDGSFHAYDENISPEPLSQLGVAEQSKKISLRNGFIPSYKNLCNGLYDRNHVEMMTLKCRYDHLNSPWLYLMPAKIEELLKDPQIIFFHQVLTDGKIRKLQELSLIMQEEASTVGPYGNYTQTDLHIRDSFLTFVPSFLSSEVLDINKITSYLTGLDAVQKRDGEELQVNVYRPGGHYFIHNDGFGENLRLTKEFGRKKSMQNGDRVATLMFYLNDVKEGGRTAFPELGLAVNPEKGGATLWFSLFDDGRLDTRAVHAGCPVVSGIKWVTNKWIHYNSQLFKRPCLAK